MTITRDALTTFFTGALGALTFGGYASSQYSTFIEQQSKLNEANNKLHLKQIELQNVEWRVQKQKDQLEHENRIEELTKRKGIFG